MRYDTRYRTRTSFFGGSLPPGVRWLLILNVAIYLVDLLLSISLQSHAFGILALVPYDVIHRGMLWQPVTWMFVHDVGGITHILFNMLALWMFGAPVEQTWGTRRFLQFYFLCGIGAALCVIVSALLFGGMSIPTVGASGAIFGLLLAFGMLFPDMEILLMFLFPMKAKYAVMVFGAIEFILLLQGGSGVSRIAHLGGMLFGYLYIRSQFSRRPAYAKAGGSFRLDLNRRWKEYKLQRAKKKFQVYMKKHGSGPLQ